MPRQLAISKNLIHHPYILQRERRIRTPKPPCDVFLSHRGPDTRRNFAGLLHYYLTMIKLHPFLDCKSMKPGDDLFHKIDEAIHKCKVGVAIFSPRYCESPFCLRELALLTEMNKRMIPIFLNVKPSQLQIVDNGKYSAGELQRFGFALNKFRNTVGITFNTSNGDWSKLIKNTSDVVIKNLEEVANQDLLEDNENKLDRASRKNKH